MKRLRRASVLTIFLVFGGTAVAGPSAAPQADVLAHLSAAFTTHDPARIIGAFRAMGEYGEPASSIVESTVNSIGYELLAEGESHAAITVFDLNTEAFPASAEAWGSLAGAYLSVGDRETALHYYRQAMRLDPDNREMAQLVEKVRNERQLSYASEKKTY